MHEFASSKDVGLIRSVTVTFPDEWLVLQGEEIFTFTASAAWVGDEIRLVREWVRFMERRIADGGGKEGGGIWSLSVSSDRLGVTTFGELGEVELITGILILGDDEAGGAEDSKLIRPEQAVLPLWGLYTGCDIQVDVGEIGDCFKWVLDSNFKLRKDEVEELWILLLSKESEGTVCTTGSFGRKYDLNTCPLVYAGASLDRLSSFTLGDRRLGAGIRRPVPWGSCGWTFWACGVRGKSYK